MNILQKLWTRLCMRLTDTTTRTIINSQGERIAQLSQEVSAQSLRADLNYRAWRSSLGSHWALTRKLERSKKWNEKHANALAKMKEQSKHDQEFAEKQKQQIADLKAEIAHLWEGKEEIQIIRCDEGEPKIVGLPEKHQGVVWQVNGRL